MAMFWREPRDHKLLKSVAMIEVNYVRRELEFGSLSLLCVSTLSTSTSGYSCTN